MTFVSLLHDSHQQCHLCNARAVLQHYTFVYCKRCYVHLLEKRMKKALRGKLTRAQPLVVVGALASFFFARLYPNFSFQQITETAWKAKEYPADALVVVPLTQDDLLKAYFSHLFFKTLSFPQFSDHELPFFKYVRDEELSVVSRLFHLPFSVQPKDHPFDQLEEKIPGIGSRFFQNMETLAKLLQRK